MKTSHPGRAALGGLCAVLTALTLTAAGAQAVDTASPDGGLEPAYRRPDLAYRGRRRSRRSRFRGRPVPGSAVCRAADGEPALASPAAPRPGGGASGTPRSSRRVARSQRRTTRSCRRAPFSEDCLYLNIYTPTLRRSADRPVLVWIHGGGFTEDGARNYDGSKLAAAGPSWSRSIIGSARSGFLAHPALARHPGARPVTTG